MPANKKPRKKRNLRKPIALNCFRARDIRSVLEMLENVELAGYLKLHKGECSYEDITSIHDLIGATLFAVIHRRNALDGAEVAPIADDLVRAGSDIRNVIRRGIEKQHFVCTGDELQRIQGAMCVTGQFFRDSFEGVSASTMLNEMNASFLIRDAILGRGNFNVTRRIVDIAYDIAINLNRLPTGSRAEAIYRRDSITRLRQLLDSEAKRNPAN